MAFYILPTRMWEFLLGALIVFVKTTKFASYSHPVVANVFSMLGIVFITGSVFIFEKSTPFPGFYALFPTLGTVFLIIFADDKTLVGKFLSNKVLVGIGLISYSAYLWHQPIFAFYRYQIDSNPTVEELFLLILITLSLSFFTWKYIEIRFRSKNIISKKSILIFSIVGTLFFALVGFAGHMVDPKKLAIVRFDEDKLRTIISVAHNPYRDQCHFDQNESALINPPCTYFSNNVGVAVVGNSHAAELAYSLAEALKPFNDGIVHHTMSGCVHNYKIQEEQHSLCGRWHAGVYRMITERASIHTVVLSYRNEISLTDKKYRDSLATLANDLSSAGKRVILVLQAPMPLMHINQHLSSAMPNLSGSIPSRKLSDWQAMYASSADLLKLLNKDIHVVDPASLFCDNDYCYATRDGIALFFDDDHMSLAGAKLIVDQFIDTIKKPWVLQKPPS